VAEVKKHIRYTWFTLWYVVIISLVLAAVSLSVVRIALTFAGDYIHDIETWAKAFVGETIAIENMDAEWQGFEPLLVLNNVELFTEKTEQSFAKFSKLKIGINLFASAQQGTIVPGSLTVEGARMKVLRHQDGHITVEGMAANDSAPTKNNNDQTVQAEPPSNDQVLGNWFLSRELVQIKDSEIIWTDRQTDRKDLEFSKVNLELRNSDDVHQLTGSVNLPSEFGRKLNFAMNLDGNILVANAWSGKIFLSGDRINIHTVLPKHEVGRAQLSDGSAVLSLWSEWRNGKLENVSGKIKIHDGQIASLDRARLLVVDELSTDFAFFFTKQGWRLLLDRLVLSDGKNHWPETRVVMEHDKGNSSYTLKASYINFVELSRALVISQLGGETLTDFFEQAKPNGSAMNLQVNYRHSDQPQFTVQTEMRGLNMFSWRKIPGFKNVSGSLHFTQSSGNMILYSRDWTFRYPWLFAQAFDFTQLSGEVNWVKVDQEWVVDAHDLKLFSDDLTLDGRFNMRFPQGKPPFLDMIFRVASDDASKVYAYMPVGIMNTDVVSWMQRSIRRGKVVSGGAVFYGQANEFPFRENTGKFNLQLGIKDVSLDYLPGWPTIKNIDGEFRYSGYDLEFVANQGNIFSNRLSNVVVAVEDLKVQPLLLKIDGEVSGNTQDKLRYLHRSPLEQVFARHLQPFNLSGESHLKLGLSIPLSKGAETKVDGEIEFSNNRLSAPGARLDIYELNGILNFTETNIWSSRLTGRMGKQALNARIDTADTAFGRDLVISHQGVVDGDDMRYLFATFLETPHWADYLRGQSHMNLDIHIPISSIEETQIPVLNVSSNLIGMAVELPYPMLKTIDDAVKFDLAVDLAGLERKINLKYGNTHALFQLNEVGDSLELVKGGIGFNTLGSIPTEFGFRFNGKLDKFYWSQWDPLLFPTTEVTPLLATGGGGSSIFFDVSVQDLEVFGSKFKNTDIQASGSSQGWTVHTSGPDLTGDMFVPSVWKSSTLTMDMERLVIKTDPTQESSVNLDPRDLPEVRISAGEFEYNNSKFGHLELVAKQRPGVGLNLQRLIMQSKNEVINATGNWLADDVKQQSKFEIKMHSQDLGKSLTNWGYEGTFAEGITDFDIQASWDGKPTDFAFERLDGKISMKIQGGRLLAVDPGASRLLSVLSLPALPRRIFLDFRDLFAKGMTFDLIKGDFDIRNGDAFTSDLLLDGPTMKINMAGRVGLAKEDYDQVIHLNVKVAESLPLLGVLAVEPTMGVTLLVLKTLFQKQIDDLSTLQYTVTGPWDNPVIEKVERGVGKVEEEFIDQP